MIAKAHIDGFKVLEHGACEAKTLQEFANDDENIFDS